MPTIYGGLWGIVRCAGACAGLSTRSPPPFIDTGMAVLKSQETAIMNNLVSLHDDSVVTSSLQVAEFFGKNHKDVLRSVRTLKCSSEYHERNFAPVKYLDAKGESRLSFNMTKDGFIFLAMGFTGKKAAGIKEAYINAFNDMAAQLQALQAPRVTASCIDAHQVAEVARLVNLCATCFHEKEAARWAIYKRIHLSLGIPSTKRIPIGQYESLTVWLSNLYVSFSRFREKIKETEKFMIKDMLKLKGIAATSPYGKFDLLS